MKRLLFLLLWFSAAMPAAAEQTLLMARVDMKATDTMEILKETIREYGYEVAHVQRCDGGMAEFDYKTDFYRVVFFGKYQEVRGILRHYPEMAPFVPLKIAVIAEEDQTVLAALDPKALGHLFGHDPVLQVQFARWHNDIHSMMEELRRHAERGRP